MEYHAARAMLVSARLPQRDRIEQHNDIGRALGRRSLWQSSTTHTPVSAPQPCTSTVSATTRCDCCKACSGEVRSLWMQYCPTCLLQRRLVVCTAAGSRSGTADGRASVRVGLRRSFGLNESVTAESPQFEHRLSTRNAAIMPKKTTQRTSNTELEARPTPHVPCASAADHAMAWTPMSARAHYTSQQLPSP
jgi:hypothetical protein